MLKRGQNIKCLPYVVTEHGALMAASVLNSPHAVQMSVFERTGRQAVRIGRTVANHDGHIKALFGAIRQLMAPPAVSSRRIGFRWKEEKWDGEMAKVMKPLTTTLCEQQAEAAKLDAAIAANLKDLGYG
jgi:hypothetical protein